MTTVQHFFIYKGQPTWTEDRPEPTCDPKGGYYLTFCSFRAVVGLAGSTGTKTHIGTVTIMAYDDGQLRIWNIHASCAAGTASRGGCSGARDIHSYYLTGKHNLTCGHKICKKWSGVDLDKENDNAWVAVRTHYGLVPYSIYRTRP